MIWNTALKSKIALNETKEAKNRSVEKWMTSMIIQN